MRIQFYGKARADINNGDSLVPSFSNSLLGHQLCLRCPITVFHHRNKIMSEMEDNLERLQSIVAKSNLTATAGEFIPKSQTGLEENSNAQYETFFDSYHDSNYGMFGNQVNNYATSQPDGIVAGSSRDGDSYYAHSSRQHINKPSNLRSYSKGSYSGNDVFFADNREPKSFKFNKWRNPDLVKSKNKNEKKYNDAGFDQGFDTDENSQKKNFNRYKQKPKYNLNNFSTSINPFEKNKTYFKNDTQFKNYSESERLSWRRKDRPNEQGEQSQAHFSRSKHQQNVGATVLSGDVGIRRNGSYTNKSSNKFKYNVKNFNPGEEDVCGNENGVIDNNEVKSMGKTSQREHLIDLLTHGILECLVCCEFIYQSTSVWSCSNCYHVLHLKCIIKWAKSSKSDFGWRCPACQNVTDKVPFEYYCFCGKARDPEWNHQDCPHSCGDICGKTQRNSCPHKCTLLCHPGPCPQCNATISKSCGCGRTTKTIQCSSSEVVVCDNVCGKELNCLIHGCEKKCHIEVCQECSEMVPQDCFCGKEHREVKCTIEAIGVKNFSCGSICQKKLACGNHFCTLICHEGDCPRCELTPDLIKFCPCGKTELTLLKEEERKSCNDPIPTCESVCGKSLICSQPGHPHTCQSKCHEGNCPVCPLEATVRCKCGHMDKQIPCSELNSRSEIRCDRRCTKKRSCGKHKCNQLCCTGVDHECPLPCNRLLQCGLHRCEQTCHKGHCKPCLQASFEELSCECGAEVIFPPVPCGTRRPPCERPCTRAHICNHPPTHNCHSENQCPPCTVLTKKYCHGRHELRKAVPCHQESFSCGLPCGREIECGRHKCILPCHSGPCLQDNQPCVQPCTVPRSVCSHICGSPCHEGPCPTDTPCKEMVRVTCECGHRFTTKACHDNVKEYQRIATAKLATKMADLQAGQSIDLNDVVGTSKKLSYKTLECNDECKLIERNRRLAIALQIRNPDLSAKLTPRYSEYLKNWAKRDARFCQMVHDKLTDLVQLAKQSKQKSRSYSFDPMNREKRHFIHEYCEHFGCESVAYDQEPKRNVVATAVKEKSWLPSMSIVEFIQKENSPRKVPAPVIAKTMPSMSKGAMEVLPSKILPNHQADPAEGSFVNNSAESQIDYFDWRP